jgi:hypothetical protein
LQSEREAELNAARAQHLALANVKTGWNALSEDKPMQASDRTKPVRIWRVCRLQSSRHRHDHHVEIASTFSFLERARLDEVIIEFRWRNFARRKLFFPAMSAAPWSTRAGMASPASA